MARISTAQSVIITAVLTILSLVSLIAAHPVQLDGKAQLPDCEVAAQRMFASQDWTGDALDVACFGSEYAPGTILALEYGQTTESYAAAERLNG